MIHEMCAAWTIVGAMLFIYGEHTKNEKMMGTATVIVALASILAFR